MTTALYVPGTLETDPKKQNMSLQLIGARVSYSREPLTANRTYYVSTTGSDSNNGLTSAGAFLTIQQAFTAISSQIDAAGYDITIDIAGAYTVGGTLSGRVGSGTVTLTSSTSASITTTGANCIAASNGARLYVTGNITLSTITSGICLVAYSGGSIYYGGITFGSCAGVHVQAGWVLAGSGGNLVAGPGTAAAISSYTITGSAVGHLHATNEGSIIHLLNGITVTLTGTPNFSAFFVGVTKGFVYLYGATFSGAATGLRYIAHNASQIFGATSRTVLPGSIAGQVAAAGTYTIDDSDNDTGFNNILATGYLATGAPATLTGTSGAVTGTSLIVNPSGAFTLTLPSAASYPGRWVNLKSIAAQTVDSASANIVPLAGGAAATAIFPATAGKWANLQSDGTSWVVMAGN